MCAITSIAEAPESSEHRCAIVVAIVVALAHLRDARYRAGGVDEMFLSFGNITERTTR